MKFRWIVHKWSEYPSRFCDETRLMHWIYRSIAFVIDNTLLRRDNLRELELRDAESRGR